MYGVCVCPNGCIPIVPKLFPIGLNLSGEEERSSIGYFTHKDGQLGAFIVPRPKKEIEIRERILFERYAHPSV